MEHFRRAAYGNNGCALVEWTANEVVLADSYGLPGLMLARHDGRRWILHLYVVAVLVVNDVLGNTLHRGPPTVRHEHEEGRVSPGVLPVRRDGLDVLLHTAVTQLGGYGLVKTPGLVNVRSSRVDHASNVLEDGQRPGAQRGDVVGEGEVVVRRRG